MASTALEEKINKIRLQNEEIKRRYEEVEADKKNAAKLDALIEPIPPEDWPERKEPPEFSASSSKTANKPKHSVRKHNDQPAQYNTGSTEGKKTRTFADGQGPPPDPKYNFLADSEREEHAEEIPRDTDRNRGRNKTSRGGFKRRGSGRDRHAKELWNQQGNPGDMTHLEYEAWRAERNRIDEARINRQRTAEGNWRREWDNDKIHLANEVTKRENRVTLGDVTRQDHSENDKHYRSPRTPTSRISHHLNPREFHQGSVAFSDPIKSYPSVGEPEKRVVIATEKSIKVLLNTHGSTPSKTSTPVMSVKVSSPNIAGTGRVGPRQRPRVMYSSQSEADVGIHGISAFTRQKSTDESTRARNFDQTHKPAASKSPNRQRKRDTDVKSNYPARKDNERVEITMKSYAARKDNERADITMKSSRKDSQKSPHPSRHGTSSNYSPKSPRTQIRSGDSIKNDFTKSRTQHENISETNASFVEEASKESNEGDAGNTFEGSAAVKDDKSNELLNRIESNDDNNQSAQLEIEAFPTNAENYIISGENDIAALGESLLETPASSTHEFVPVSLENGTNNEKKKELRGQIETHDERSNNSIDVESSDIQVIDCSANSGLMSNDSGFIELPSNDSIHNVSDHVEIFEVTGNCSKSMPSTSQAGQNHPIIENHVESEVTDEKVNDAESSSKNLGTTFGSLQLIDISAETSNNSHDTEKAEMIVLESQGTDPGTDKAAEDAEDVKSSNDESTIISISPKIVAQGNADEPAVVETTSDSGNAGIMELASQEKNPETKEVTGNKQDGKSIDDESAIVSISPKIVAQENADESAVVETASLSDHEKNAICDKLQT